jgi:flagellar biosynthesis protein FlhG
MPDQADKLRQLACTAPPPIRDAPSTPPLIVVTGGKSGVGATTAAVNLAAALADAGLRTVLVDAARTHANLAQVAGVHLPETETASLQPGPAGSLLLTNGRAFDSDAGDSRRAQQHLLAEIQSLNADADIVVVDTGSGMTPWTRRFWRQAQMALVVTTTDDAAVMASYATIKLAAVDDSDADIRVLVNQCDKPALADEVLDRISAACQRFLGRPVAALPSLPRYSARFGNDTSLPRIWEAPDTCFGHAALWLGRAVIDVIAAPLAA